MGKEIPCPQCQHIWVWAEWKLPQEAFCPKGYGCNETVQHTRIEKLEANLKMLFELIEREEESGLGVRFNPVVITCSREQDRLRLNEVLKQLKSMIGE